MTLGNEPVFHDGTVVSRVTSGGIGYTVGASIAYAYLPVELAVAGTVMRGRGVRGARLRDRRERAALGSEGRADQGVGVERGLRSAGDSHVPGRSTSSPTKMEPFQ